MNEKHSKYKQKLKINVTFFIGLFLIFLGAGLSLIGLISTEWNFQFDIILGGGVALALSGLILIFRNLTSSLKKHTLTITNLILADGSKIPYSKILKMRETKYNPDERTGIKALFSFSTQTFNNGNIELLIKQGEIYKWRRVNVPNDQVEDFLDKLQKAKMSAATTERGVNTERKRVTVESCKGKFFQKRNFVYDNESRPEILVIFFIIGLSFLLSAAAVIIINLDDFNNFVGGIVMGAIGFLIMIKVIASLDNKRVGNFKFGPCKKYKVEADGFILDGVKVKFSDITNYMIKDMTDFVYFGSPRQGQIYIYTATTRNPKTKNNSFIVMLTGNDFHNFVSLLNTVLNQNSPS